jgi:predicted HTH domain antitoxin
MNISISDHLVQQTGISAEEILLKIAILLFSEERITLAQASGIAGIHQISFQKELAKRNIPLHYGSEEYKSDLETAKSFV